MCEAAGCSLMDEIKKIEESVTMCYSRVYLLKSKLRSHTISDEQRETFKQDLQEVEKLLTTNKTILKGLRKGNQRTFLVASALFLIIFITWMLYHLAFNESY